MACASYDDEIFDDEGNLVLTDEYDDETIVIWGNLGILPHKFTVSQ